MGLCSEVNTVGYCRKCLSQALLWQILRLSMLTNAPARMHKGTMPQTSSSAQIRPEYRRIVLKISGEALRDKKSGESIDGEILQRIALEIKKVHDMGVQIGIVVGGGNIFRGQLGEKFRGIDRTTGDFMGMLSTMINGMALMDCLEKNGVPVRLQSAIPVNEVAEPFILRRAIRHLEKGRVVVFVAGTGNPYFTTDTTAALRASEIQADVILKATKVDGVYDKDPVKHKDASKFTRLTFMEALRNRYNIMDSTAFSLCLDNNLPIIVFSMMAEDSIKHAVLGQPIGTLVHGENQQE